jgi:hypothetical protein
MSQNRILRLGKATDSDVRWQEKEVEDHHGYFIIHQSGIIEYVDTSKKGTVVNGKRLHKAALLVSFEDILEVGGKKLDWKLLEKLIKDEQSKRTVAFRQLILPAALLIGVIVLGIALGSPSETQVIEDSIAPTDQKAILLTKIDAYSLPVDTVGMEEERKNEWEYATNIIQEIKKYAADEVSFYEARPIIMANYESLTGREILITNSNLPSVLEEVIHGSATQ